MAGNSFHIDGEATNTLCNLRRISLAREVYRVDQAEIEAADAIPFVAAKVDKALEEWEEAHFDNDQAKSGYVAKLFTSTHDTEDHSCAPTLSFRGSDFHRWTGLGIYVRIKCGPIVFGIVFKTADTEIADSIPEFQFFHARGSGSSPLNPLINWADEQRVNQYFTGLGFETTIRKNVDMRIWIEGVRRWMPAIPVGANVTLKIYTHTTKGDWATNIRQTFGQKSEQYERAWQTLRDVALNEKHAPSKDLFLIGHSLGGGLASHVSVLAAAYKRYNFIDDLKCVTLNAAGLHEKTVAPYKLSDGRATNFSVRDEVLSLMQSFSDRLPIVGKLLEHLDVEIPEALGTPTDFGAHHFREGAYVPVDDLFPVPDTIAPKMKGLNDAFNSGGSLQDSINNTVEWIYDNYHEVSKQEVVNDKHLRAVNDVIIEGIDADLSSEEIMEDIEEVSTRYNVWLWEMYGKMFELLGQDLGPEIEEYSTRFSEATLRHGFEYIIPTYERQIGPYEGPL